MKHEAIKIAEEFAEEITKCDEYKKFIEANKSMGESQSSIDLMNKLNQKQMELKYNGISEELMNELKELQNKVNEDKVIQNLLTTQEELIKLLRETNNVISEEIDSPFAFSMGGGCCG